MNVSYSEETTWAENINGIDEVSLVFAMGSSLHGSQDHEGSWEYGQHWSLRLTLGMSCVGHTIPHRAELSSVDPLEEKTDWYFPGTIWKPPSRPQGMRGMGTFGQCPGCSPHVPRLMPSEGRKGNLFFFKYTLTFQFRLKTEMSAWFCYWLFSMWYLEIKRGS